MKKELEKELKEILNFLYNSNENRILYTEDIKNKFKNLEEILKTSSLNKWFIKYKNPFIFITEKWINYFEDQRKNIFIKIGNHINNFWNFYTVIIAFLALIISIISLIVAILK